MAGIPQRNRQRSAWRMALWSGAALLLLLPWVAMQFTDQMAWDATDFILLGAMLVVACGAYELATRMSRNPAYRAAFGVAIAAAFLLVWVNLAVGIIGSPDNPANLMVFGVPVVGLIGAFVARLQPRGMARSLVATAAAQVLVALIADWGMGLSAPVQVVGITAVFVVPWLASAALFRKAARAQTCARSAED